MTMFNLGAAGPNVTIRIMGIGARVRKYADISKEFSRVAANQQTKVKKAEEGGPFVTVRDNYFGHAVLCGMANNQYL